MQWESQQRDSAPAFQPAAAGRASRWTRWARVGVVGCLWGLVFSLAAQDRPSSDASSDLDSIELAPAQRTLNWADSSQQLVVIGTAKAGWRFDLTSEAEFVLSNDRVGRIDSSALFHPLSDGETEIKAVVRGREATARFRVRQSAKNRPLSFARDIGGILTKRGCNGAGCHGGVKGQNGFRLSDNAGHPHDDYKWIVEGGLFQVMSSESGGPKVPRIGHEGPREEPAPVEANDGGPARWRTTLRKGLG